MASKRGILEGKKLFVENAFSDLVEFQKHYQVDSSPSEEEVIVQVELVCVLSSSQ